MIVLISVGAIVAIPIPISPVPLVLQNAFVVLTGIVLAPHWAVTTVIIYIALGALGLPVFSGASGGVAHLVGPTAGYLWAYPFSAFVASWIVRLSFSDRAPAISGNSFVRYAVALLVGFAVPYVGGVPWLAATLDRSIPEALAIGFLPFAPLDAIKAIALFFVVRTPASSLWTD
jgi:biotin transport system substrate-specific component